LISQNRLRASARENKVTVGLMEKDYVNSWILYAIYNSPLKNQLSFKGGTALSKIYFPKIWRFSEDLDLTANKKMSEEWFVNEFESALSNASKKSGIDFDIRSTHFQSGYAQIKVQYKAVLKRRNTTKIDITQDEVLTYGLEERTHSSEDVPEFNIIVYSLDEIIVEKVRSLFERKRARDFFDVYKILEMGDVEDLEKFVKNLRKKMRHKDMDLVLDLSESKVEDIKTYWNMDLDRFVSTAEKPEFSKALRKVKTFLEEIKSLEKDMA